jgi:membrane-associated phospholipid phosphatase
MRAMNGILAWGLDLIRTVQQIANPTLTVVMKVITFLGTEWFYLAALPLIYWCVDRRRGVRVGLLFLFSSFVNLWTKDLWMQPRPFEFDPKVGFAHETSYGLPSGHAQGSAVFFGTAAPLFRKPWGLVLAIVMPLVIGFSRIYLGVHFPTDVFAGWLIGGAIVAVDAIFGDRISAFLEKQAFRTKAIAIALIALVMNFLDQRDTSIAGIFLGAGLGFLLAEKYAAFEARGGLGSKVLRYLVGLAGAAVLYLGLKAVLPGQGEQLYTLCRFLRYALVGAWIGFGAPWVFLKLRLAEPSPAQAPAPAGDAESR